MVALCVPDAGPAAYSQHHRSYPMAKPKRATARRKRVRAKPKAKPHANSRTKPRPRPHGNRLVFSPELLADGKRRYETTEETLDSIALDFSSNRSTLRNVAKREGWKRYVPPPRGLSRAAEIAAQAEALEAEALEAEAALSSPPPERGGCRVKRGGRGSFQRHKKGEAGRKRPRRPRRSVNPGACASASTSSAPRWTKRSPRCAPCAQN